MLFLRHRLSIRAQLLLLVLSVVLPAAGIFAYYVVDELHEAREAAYAKVKILADNTIASLDLILRDHETVLSRLAERPLIRALDARNFDPVVGEFTRLHPEFNNLGVRDLHANNIYSIQLNPSSPQAAREFPWFQEGIRSGKFTAGNAFLGRLVGRWVSVLTYPVRDDEGKVSGLINMSLDLLKLNERLFQHSPKNAVQVVLDREDKFLLRSIDPAIWIGKPLAGAQADAIRGRSADFFSMRGMDGVQRLYVVAAVPGTQWRVFAGLPEDEVFADYRERLVRAVVIGLAVLLLVLVLAWHIGVAIATPIRELAGTATRIAGGEAAARARLAGPAEIEYVAQQFNRMLDVQDRQREERAALVGHFERLVRLARDIFLLLDPSGNIVEANAAAVAAYGYSADELRGMNIRDLRASESQATLEQDWQATTRSGGALLETVHRRKDGSTFPVEDSARTIDIEGKLYRQSFIRDISERHTAEAQIRRLNSAYATLSETNQAIVRLHDVTELFPRICRIAVEFGGYIGAWVGLVDEQSRRIVPVAIDGSIDDYVRQIKVSIDPAQPEGRGPGALAVREGRPYYCQDFLEDPVTESWHDLALKFGVRSSTALPLRRAGAVIGMLSLYSAEPGVFNAPMRALLEEMAVDISFALDNFEREAARQQAEDKLARSEAYYRGLFENMQEGFAFCRMILENGQPQDFIYLSVNDSFERLTGLKNVVGRKVTELIPGIRESNPELFEVYGRVAATGRSETTETYLPALNVWFSISVYRPEPGHFAAIFVDITERKRAARELAESEARFRGLVEQSIAGIYIIQDGTFAYANPRLAEIHGYGFANEIIGLDPLPLVVEKDRGTVAENNRQLLAGEIPSVDYSFIALGKNGSSVEVGVHSSLATYRGRPAIIGLLQDISEKKRAEKEIQRYLEQLKTAFMSTVEVATIISEMRDPYTAGHERRVAEIAVAIGAELGFDARRQEGLQVAGHLHDIGKITIPSEILSKPGKLSAIEFQLVQGHAQASYDVLKGVEFPWPVAQVALQHHERMDGSGYPQGLKGEAILLDARIMAVADVVEAMSSHRPYRPGLGIDKALAEIERGRGTAYDADVADACLRLFREKRYQLPA